jgi:hydroxyacylglutathione hydrolase
MTSAHAAGAFGPWQLFLLPALSDNYIYLLFHNDSGYVVVIDPGEKTPVDNWLFTHQATLHTVLLTHHHHDHIGAASALRRAYDCRIIGAVADRERLPALDHELEEGQIFFIEGQRFETLTIPGHTLGHVAYYLPEAGLLFCGDTLFSLGCGRLFEGTPEMMHASLSLLASLPDDTHVCCGHEYTLANARFALTIEPENAALRARYEHAIALRAQGLPTLPVPLAIEKAANPFLRTGDDIPRFASLRARKDLFQ